VGALAGLTATAGTAILAVKGIQDEMKQGTTIGQQYTAGMKVLNNEFTTLKQLAAAGTLSGFQAGIKALQPLFSTLNRDMSLFSTQLGAIVGHTMPALVSLFHQLNPLFVTIGQALVDGSANFQHWAQSSTSVSKFVAFVQNELPNVLHFLGELATLAGHAAQAFAPLGSSTLTVLSLLAQAINAIPINVLATAVPIITATVLAFKGFRTLEGLSSTFAGFSAKLAGMGGAAAGAAGLVSGASKTIGAMGIAGLVAGPAIGLLVSWLGKQKQAQAEAKAEVNDYTQALLASNLAIDASVRGQVAKKLADTNAFQAAKTLGIAQGTLTDAVTGTGTASADLAARLAPLVENYKRMTASSPKGQLTDQYKATLNTATAANDLNNILSKQSVEFKLAAGSAADQKAAIDGVARSQGMSAATAAANAKAMGLTTAEYLVGSDAAKKNAASIDKQTQAMQFSNDAAGLLKQSLDALNGVTLDVAAAQTTASSAWLSMTKTIHDNGNTTKLNTDAGVANRQAIEQGVRANQSYAEAEAKKTKSGAAANKMLTDQRTAFIGAIEKTYGANSAIAVYVRSIYGIPAKKTTAIDAETAAADKKIADLKARLAEFGPKTITVLANVNGAISAIRSVVEYAANQTAVIHVTTTTASHGTSGGKQVFAGGGTVEGEGGSREDRVVAHVSPGEEIIQADAAAKHRPLLKAINAGSFANGGTVGGQSAVYAMRNAIQSSKPLTVNAPASPRQFGGGTATATAAPASTHVSVNPVVRVFIGDTELKGMVRVEVDGQMNQLADHVTYGRK
jgi:hypothetical protein